MDRQKLIIVLLVAIAMIYVITVGLGARGDGGGSSDDSDPIAFLEGLRSDRFFLLEDDFGTSCQDVRSPSEVAVTVPCSIDVPSPGRFSRPASVVVRATAPVQIRLEPDRGPALEEVVGDESDECVQTAMTGGGRVVLTPVGGQPAVVEFDDENCPEED